MICEPLDWYSVATLPHPTDVLTSYREHDPVHWGTARLSGSSGSWYLTRYDDIVQALRSRAAGHMRKCPHDRGTRVLEGSAFTIDQVLDRWFVFLDPPDHERLRSTVNKGLQSAARELRPRIGQIARSLIAGLPGTEPVELLRAYAYPIATIAMADVLGLPASDSGLLIGWASRLIQLFDKPDPNSMAGVHGALVEFFAYVGGIIGTGHRAGRAGLLGNLLDARDAGSISDDEVVATAALLLLASAETTPTLIGNAILLLLQHPDQLALVRNSHDLIESAIDEVLRYESPVQFTGRRAFADFDVGGKTIREGDYIVALYNSANRDPRAFKDPERFDIARRGNRHLGFGAGIHNCVGARLGHLIAQIAVLDLIVALPELALIDQAPAWRGHDSIRGLQSLRVTL